MSLPKQRRHENEPALRVFCFVLASFCVFVFRVLCFDDLTQLYGSEQHYSRLYCVLQNLFPGILRTHILEC